MVSKCVNGDISGGFAYNDHGKEDETSSSGLQGALVAVDRIVGAQRSQDEATAQVSNDSDTVDIACIGTKSHNQADDNAEHITGGPPGVVGVTSLQIGNDR
jgi:hypothetical protein